MREALKGVTVLEIGTMTPGKFAGFLLTGWGAEAIRVERPGEAGQLTSEDLLLNRGKRSLTLNLRTPEGLAALLRLAARADVLVEAYRPGVADRLGIGWEAVRAVNPRLVYCSLSGFGQDGPDSHRPAFDLLFQAESGYCHLLAMPGAAPAPTRTYVADAVAGLMTAYAISAALRQREVTGTGSRIDLGMLEGIFTLLAASHGTLGENGLSAGADSEGFARRPSYDIYPASDGRYLCVAAARPASCRALFEHFGRPDLAEHGMDGGEQGRPAADFLRQTFATRPAQHWVDELRPLDIEAARVNTAEEALAHPQLVARGMVVESTHPTAGRLRQVGMPGLGAGAAPFAPAPEVGRDSEAVLREAGYDADAIRALREAGAI